MSGRGALYLVAEKPAQQLSSNGQHSECDRWTRTHPETVLFSQIDLPHYKTSMRLPLHPYFLLPHLLIKVSIPRTSRSVPTLWSGPGQLLQWVIVISLCLDQSTVMQSERMRMGARGTTDYSHQQHICEATTVLWQDPVLSNLNLIVSSRCHTSTDYIPAGDCHSGSVLPPFLIAHTKQTNTHTHTHTHARTYTNPSHTVSAYTSACGIGVTLYRSLKEN